MKNRLIVIIILLILVNGTLPAQFNESEFIYRVKTMYHSLKLTGLDNFSSWVNQQKNYTRWKLYGKTRI